MDESHRQTEYERIRETIIQNAQKGQIYRIAFDHDPVIHAGMPIALAGTPPDDDTFELRMVAPPQEGEVLHRSMHNITWIEEVP